MTRLQALVGLNLSGVIGSIRLKALLERSIQPEEIFSASSGAISQASGISQESALRVLSVKKEDIEKELERAHKLKLRVMALGDEDYPHNLKFTYSPPIILYIEGELRREDNLGMAVVGSRRASVYGIAQAEKLSSQLSERGFTIVSGLARGIDTSAHRAALKVKGRTIAVIGSGFSHIYPEENERLTREISCSGAVVSEFPLDAEPLKAHFPQRNRLISGLSLGVLVIEAARNSGALITAGFALEQGRDVFALPGRVDSLNSFGPHSLIKDGAKLVSGVDDIIEELGVGLDEPVKASLPARRGPFGLREEEGVLYGLLSDKPLCLDEIAEKIDFGITDISAILLKLQLKKLIRELPGKQFIRN